MLFLTREKMAKIVIYDQARVNGGSNYDHHGLFKLVSLITFGFLL